MIIIKKVLLYLEHRKVQKQIKRIHEQNWKQYELIIKDLQ